jgi:hypothetical protein
MQKTFCALAAILLLLAACDAAGAAQGSGSENGSHARIKIGVPF